MVLFRFDLTFYGEGFAPEPFALKLEAQGVKVEWCSENTEKAFPYLSVSPDKEFSTQPNVDNHLHWFCTLLDENYPALRAGGVEKAVLFTEVFYEGGQCNMELFNHEFYACAHRCALYTPLSAYKISLTEWNKLEREYRDAYA
ncbi:hypothetical protein [Hymenobacter psoromatis]|uniref:hypothetical protein n=1 Tax=Hymenobacter psoromatis TaxID=1484116 RepID=UPI001CBFCA23|nr:hypothetical protein [Hymenobacter psoromatis]